MSEVSEDIRRSVVLSLNQKSASLKNPTLRAYFAWLADQIKIGKIKLAKEE
jgi:hypothetical protein